MYQPGKLAILAKECDRLRIDVIGLSEVRWNGCGEFRNNKGGVLMYSGMPNEGDPHVRGVAIYVRKRFQPSIISWKAISERIITVRFRSKTSNISIIQCYAPTEESHLDDKEIFYNMLEKAIQDTPRNDVKILMGDFNAQIGADNTGYETIMGTHALGRCNENGELFLELCLNNNLKIGGSIFPHKISHKTTWKSPGNLYETQIDHVCISREWCNLLCDVRNKKSGEIGSDHYLVVAEMKLKLWPKRHNTAQNNRAYNTQKMKAAAVKERFIEGIYNINTPNDNAMTADDTWTSIKTNLQDLCKKTLGYRQSEQKEWISEESWDLIERRRTIKIALTGENDPQTKERYNDEYSSISKLIERQIKLDKKKFYDDKGIEAQTAAEKGDMKELFGITRTLAGGNFNGRSPVLDDDSGTLVTDKQEQLQVWKKHFEKTLNIIHNDEERFVIRRRLDPDSRINVNTPDVNEICAAIKSMKCGKAAGNDGLPIECFKAEPYAMARILYPLFVKIWSSESFPSEWKESTIIKLPKKGDKKKCNNWRGISLLPAAFKIFNKVVLDRIAEKLNDSIRNTQAGFRPGRSCIDQISTVRILIEQAAEFNSTMYLTFIDYEKAFDALKREYIWMALDARGIPQKIINIIKSSYEESKCRVLHDGALSDSFTTNSGVRQGCALSPLLFITVMDIVFDAIDALPVGLNWRMYQKLGHLEYADDVVLLSNRQTDMQTLITSLTNESIKVGLKANIPKTKAMRVNATNSAKLTVSAQEIDDVTSFEYLGSIISTDGGTILDVENRLKKAKGSFAMLSKVWRSNTITNSTKVRIFDSCVKSTLLFGCETWFLTKALTRKLQTFINRCLRNILRIWWPRTVSNENLLNRTRQLPIENEIKKRKYGWLGHTLRKGADEITHSALEWNPQGQRGVGRPKMTWRRTVAAETSKTFNQLRCIARNRTEWKSFVKNIYL